MAQADRSSFPRNATVGVAGGRDFRAKGLLFAVLDRYHEQYGIRWIVSGGANGADTYAESWAKARQIEGYTVHLPQWEKFGKSAGMQRNLTIVDDSDVIIGFPTGESVGTWMTIERGQAKGLHVITCKARLHWPELEENSYEITTPI